MRAENKAMGLEDEEDEEDDDEGAEGYDADNTAEHPSPSPSLLDEEASEPTEALSPQVVQTEDEQGIPESDKSSKRRKGKGKAEPTAAPRLSKAEQKALEREAALQSVVGKGEASDNVPKFTKKAIRKTQNGIIDTMATATGRSTPAELEPSIEGGTSEMQSPEPGVVPEMSKKDKRRAKEAAKKAQQEVASSSVNLVSRDSLFTYERGVLIFPGQRCNVCQQAFESKTKLYNHIRDEGHAAAVEGPKGGKKGKRK